MYYQEQFPGVRIAVCPVVTQGITKENWFLDDHKIDVVLGEVERCGSQFHEILKSRVTIHSLSAYEDGCVMLACKLPSSQADRACEAGTSPHNLRQERRKTRHTCEARMV